MLAQVSSKQVLALKRRQPADRVRWTVGERLEGDSFMLRDHNKSRVREVGPDGRYTKEGLALVGKPTAEFTSFGSSPDGVFVLGCLANGTITLFNRRSTTANALPSAPLDDTPKEETPMTPAPTKKKFTLPFFKSSQSPSRSSPSDTREWFVSPTGTCVILIKDDFNVWMWYSPIGSGGRWVRIDTPAHKYGAGSRKGSWDVAFTNDKVRGSKVKIVYTSVSIIERKEEDKTHAQKLTVVTTVVSLSREFVPPPARPVTSLTERRPTRAEEMYTGPMESRVDSCVVNPVDAAYAQRLHQECEGDDGGVAMVVARWDRVGNMLAVIVNSITPLVVFISTEGHGGYISAPVGEPSASLQKHQYGVDMQWTADSLFVAIVTFNGQLVLMSRVGQSLWLANTTPFTLVAVADALSRTSPRSRSSPRQSPRSRASPRSSSTPRGGSLPRPQIPTGGSAVASRSLRLERIGDPSSTTGGASGRTTPRGRGESPRGSRGAMSPRGAIFSFSVCTHPRNPQMVGVCDGYVLHTIEIPAGVTLGVMMMIRASGEKQIGSLLPHWPMLAQAESSQQMEGVLAAWRMGMGNPTPTMPLDLQNAFEDLLERFVKIPPPPGNSNDSRAQSKFAISSFFRAMLSLKFDCSYHTTSQYAVGLLGSLTSLLVKDGNLYTAMHVVRIGEDWILSAFSKQGSGVSVDRGCFTDMWTVIFEAARKRSSSVLDGDTLNAICDVALYQLLKNSGSGMSLRASQPSESLTEESGEDIAHNLDENLKQGCTLYFNRKYADAAAVFRGAGVEGIPGLMLSHLFMYDLRQVAALKKYVFANNLHSTLHGRAALNILAHAVYQYLKNEEHILLPSPLSSSKWSDPMNAAVGADGSMICRKSLHEAARTAGGWTLTFLVDLYVSTLRFDDAVLSILDALGPRAALRLVRGGVESGDTSLAGVARKLTMLRVKAALKTLDFTEFISSIADYERASRGSAALSVGEDVAVLASAVELTVGSLESRVQAFPMHHFAGATGGDDEVFSMKAFTSISTEAQSGVACLLRMCTAVLTSLPYLEGFIANSDTVLSPRGASSHMERLRLSCRKVGRVLWFLHVQESLSEAIRKTGDHSPNSGVTALKWALRLLPFGDYAPLATLQSLVLSVVAELAPNEGLANMVENEMPWSVVVPAVQLRYKRILTYHRGSLFMPQGDTSFQRGARSMGDYRYEADSVYQRFNAETWKRLCQMENTLSYSASRLISTTVRGWLVRAKMKNDIGRKDILARGLSTIPVNPDSSVLSLRDSLAEMSQIWAARPQDEQVTDVEVFSDVHATPLAQASVESYEPVITMRGPDDAKIVGADIKGDRDEPSHLADVPVSSSGDEKRKSKKERLESRARKLEAERLRHSASDEEPSGTRTRRRSRPQPPPSGFYPVDMFRGLMSLPNHLDTIADDASNAAMAEYGTTLSSLWNDYGDVHLDSQGAEILCIRFASSMNSPPSELDWLPEAVSELPRTAYMLRQITTGVRVAAFVRLHPGARVTLKEGTKRENSERMSDVGPLIYQMALVVPPEGGCTFEAGEDLMEWNRPGMSAIYNDQRPHSLTNSSGSDMISLYLEFDPLSMRSTSPIPIDSPPMRAPLTDASLRESVNVSSLSYQGMRSSMDPNTSSYPIDLDSDEKKSPSLQPTPSKSPSTSNVDLLSPLPQGLVGTGQAGHLRHASSSLSIKVPTESDHELEDVPTTALSVLPSPTPVLSLSPEQSARAPEPEGIMRQSRVALSNKAPEETIAMLMARRQAILDALGKRGRTVTKRAGVWKAMDEVAESTQKSQPTAAPSATVDIPQDATLRPTTPAIHQLKVDMAVNTEFAMEDSLCDEGDSRPGTRGDAPGTATAVTPVLHPIRFRNPSDRPAVPVQSALNERRGESESALFGVSEPAKPPKQMQYHEINMQEADKERQLRLEGAPMEMPYPHTSTVIAGETNPSSLQLFRLPGSSSGHRPGNTSDDHPRQGNTLTQPPQMPRPYQEGAMPHPGAGVPANPPYHIQDYQPEYPSEHYGPHRPTTAFAVPDQQERRAALHSSERQVHESRRPQEMPFLRLGAKSRNGPKTFGEKGHGMTHGRPIGGGGGGGGGGYPGGPGDGMSYIRPRDDAMAPTLHPEGSHGQWGSGRADLPVRMPNVNPQLHRPDGTDSFNNDYVRGGEHTSQAQTFTHLRTPMVGLGPGRSYLNQFHRQVKKRTEEQLTDAELRGQVTLGVSTGNMHQHAPGMVAGGRDGPMITEGGPVRVVHLGDPDMPPEVTARMQENAAESHVIDSVRQAFAHPDGAPSSVDGLKILTLNSASNPTAADTIGNEGAAQTAVDLAKGASSMKMLNATSSVTEGPGSMPLLTSRVPDSIPTQLVRIKVDAKDPYDESAAKEGAPDPNPQRERLYPLLEGGRKVRLLYAARGMVGDAPKRKIDPEAAARRMVQHWTKRRLHKGWNKWYTVHKHSKKINNYNKAIFKMLNRKLAMGFEAWKHWMAMLRHRRKTMYTINKVYIRWVMREVATAWRTWAHIAQKNRQHRYLLRRSVRLMANVKIAAAMRKWMIVCLKGRKNPVSLQASMREAAISPMSRRSSRTRLSERLPAPNLPSGHQSRRRVYREPPEKSLASDMLLRLVYGRNTKPRSDFLNVVDIDEEDFDFNYTNLPAQNDDHDSDIDTPRVPGSTTYLDEQRRFLQVSENPSGLSLQASMESIGRSSVRTLRSSRHVGSPTRMSTASGLNMGDVISSRASSVRFPPSPTKSHRSLGGKSAKSATGSKLDSVQDMVKNLQQRLKMVEEEAAQVEREFDQAENVIDTIDGHAAAHDRYYYDNLRVDVDNLESDIMGAKNTVGAYGDSLNDAVRDTMKRGKLTKAGRADTKKPWGAPNPPTHKVIDQKSLKPHGSRNVVPSNTAKRAATRASNRPRSTMAVKKKVDNHLKKRLDDALDLVDELQPPHNVVPGSMFPFSKGLNTSVNTRYSAASLNLSKSSRLNMTHFSEDDDFPSMDARNPPKTRARPSRAANNNISLFLDSTTVDDTMLGLSSDSDDDRTVQEIEGMLNAKRRARGPGRGTNAA